MAHDDPVLAHERHHVRDRGDGGEVEQVERQGLRKAERRHQGLHQLERDPGPAEHAEPRFVVALLGIDDGVRGRELGTGKVMVGDHDVDAVLPRAPHRVHRGDAAVAREDEAGTDTEGFGQPRGAEVVTIAEAVGDERFRLGAGGAQRAGEERGGALPVHVVVAVDQDGVTRLHRAGDDVDRLGHAREAIRIAQPFERGAKKGARQVGIAVAALNQQPRQRLRNVECLGQTP